VDNEADAARMRADGEWNAEIFAVIHALQANTLTPAVLLCYCIPLGIADRIFGWEKALLQVREALQPGNDRSGIHSMALYGMGGVGKPQIVPHYANNSRGSFDAILWISADNSIKMAQSLLEVAQRLELISDGLEPQDSAAARSKVKTFLTQTSKRQLHEHS